MGNKFLVTLGRVFDRILDFTAFAACFLIVFLLLSVCYEVVMRYFFDAPTDWVVEYASLIVLWVPFLVAAYVLRLDKHTKMDILVGQLNPTTQAVINIVSYIICALICFGIAVFGTKVVWYYYKTGFATQTFLMIPKWPLMSVIPFSAILLFIEFIRKIFKSFGEIKSQDFSEKASGGGER